MAAASFSSCRYARVALGAVTAAAISLTLALVDLSAQGQLPIPIPGRNVNMVSGTNFPDGDPFLQRQNEPSIAVSTRNPLHLLGAANDYRTVDIPGLGDEVNGDAWLGIFKSFDGGATWKSTLLPGFRQDASPIGQSSPLYGLEAAADPVMRAGTNGLFYLGGMAFNRDQDSGKVFVARYIDDNNKEAGDTIRYLGTSVVDVGTETRFLDKPWIAVDIPRAMKGRGRNDDDDRNERGRYRDKRDRDWNRDRDRRTDQHPNQSRRPPSGPMCNVPGQAQPIAAGTIYVMYSAFIDPPAPKAKTADADRDRRRERDDEPDGGFERRKRRERENSEDHKPGTPMEGRTQIMLSRSTDCGVTFTRPAKISERTQINQGSTAAIDPNTGDVYIAWREFRSNQQPDAILVVKSTDGGASFSDPETVALINPFDQSTTPTSFRTNSYPTMAVDATGRVYVAWAQRGIGPSGDARVVISSSTNGRRWSTPVPADNHAGRGHQIMPVLSFGGGQLNLVFWDQRDDVSKKWGPFIDDLQVLADPVLPGQTRKRHTLDLRAVAAWPGAPPTWGPSAKLSNYLEGVRPGKTALDENGKPISEQLQYNAPNLPLFSLGTKPFIGDYLDMTVSPTFIANGDGTWRFNTERSDPSIYFTAFSDNRDVRPPTDPLGDLNLNGNFWDDYTPPTFAGGTGTSIFDPTQPVQVCAPGRAGMRDQNIYTNKVATGLVMTTLGNTKPLGYVTAPDGTRHLIQRTFVITVTNSDLVVKSVVLHINSQPPGGHASFLQFDQLIDLPVNIAAKSSISREVFVTSTDPKASVPITVTEGTNTTSAGRIVINPDPSNPDIENPDIENPGVPNPDIENAEAHAITVSAARVSNPDIENLSKANPDIENPDIENPDIENRTVSNLSVLNPDIENPDIENPDIENPDIENPDIENPDIENPDIENPDIENAALTDIKWDVTNVGNTATVYQVKLLLKEAQRQRLIQADVKFQLLVIKKTAAPVIGADKCKVVEPAQNLTVVNINSLKETNSDVFVDPTNEQQFATVINPDIENPDIENATVALAPGDVAEVVLRIYSPVGDTTLDPSAAPGDDNALEDLAGALEDLETVGVATTSHPVDTIAAQQGETTPVVEASIPLIVTTTLDDATRAMAYSATLEQTGATAPFSYALVSGALPPGLTLNADGTITGAPSAAGVFPFTVRLTDKNQMTATATLEIRVFEPVLPVATTLPGALVNQLYSTQLSAIGGFPPYGWALAPGSLPAGVTLSPFGVLSGTPTQSGTFGFGAMVTDSALPSKSATGGFVVNVTASASGQSVNVVEDTATPITVAGSGGGPFTFTIGNSPAHGTLSGAGPVFTYTPDLNYNGPDSFTFSVTQGSLTSSFATVSINVTAVNDAPAATPKTVNTPQGIAVPIVLTGTDPENNPLTFSIVANPTSGSLSGTGANRTYTPTAGFTGTATFTFRVNDGLLFSPAATVAVIVGPPPPNSADVTLTLTDTADPIALGTFVTYNAVIQSAIVGPASSTGVSFSLAYPDSNLLLQSASPSQGTCTTGNPIVCTIGAMANGATVIVPVTLKAFNRGGTFSVSSSVTSSLLDYNTSNNDATQSTTVTGPAVATTDLSVSQTRLPSSVAVGSNVVYTIVVTNNGPSDATGIALTNTFTSNTALFVSSTTSQGGCSAGPSQLTCAVGDLAGGSSATVTLTLKANASGSLSNTAGVSGSQSDPTAANNTHTLATPIDNRQPTAADDAVTTNEDTAHTIAVLSNDTDLDGDSLTITGVTAVPVAQGTAQIAGNSISFSPAGNFNGTVVFDYTIGDGRGGADTGTVTVTVGAVNDAPSFVKGADVSAVENGGPQAFANWANPAQFSRGPADEAGQALHFLLVSASPLFAVPPAVSLDGTLTYTPAPDANGTANVTIYLQDNGGSDNGGADTSAAQTFAISLSSVNSAPTFVIGPNQTVPEDSNTQTVPNWATHIKAGPADEAAQSVNFIVTTSNDDLFATLPSVSPDGTLTYTPAPNAFGSAEVYVSLHDNAGAPPGTDTSAPQSFFIGVTAEADPLAAVNDSATASPNPTPTSINVVGNDTGPAMVSPGRLIAFERFSPSTTSIPLGFVNETARVASTGYLYVSGGRGIAVLHPTTNSVVATIDYSVRALGAANFHQVNDTASIVYFRHGANTVSAIDGRTASATFNQVIGRLQLGSNVQSFALDESRGLLYIAYNSSGVEVAFQARLAVVDANPANPTFHQAIADVALLQNIRGMVVDSAGDRVYLASDSGMFRINNASMTSRVQVPIDTGGSLQDLVFSNGKVYGFGAGGRVAAYDPANGVNGTATSMTVPTLTTGFVLGRRIVSHAALNRIFIRSSGVTGSTGKVVVIDGNTSTWPSNAVLADIAIGRDSGSDLVVDQSRGLVIASSSLDGRISFIDATAMPPALGGELSAPIGGDIGLDPVNGRLYFASLATVQRVTLSPRALLSPIHAGAENGSAVALPGPGGSPNPNRFFVGRTALGATVRQYRTNGTPSNVTLPHTAGRFAFSAANPLTNRLYFLNSNADSTGALASPNSLVVVNGATGTTIANVDLGNNAFGIAVNPTTNKIYTGGAPNGLLPGGISVIDGVSHAVTSVTTAAFPANTAFNRYLAPLCVGASCVTVNKVYVQASQPTEGLLTVAIVNGATNTATPISSAIGANDVNLIRASNALNRVFIGNQEEVGGPNDVGVLNGTTDALITGLVGVSSPTNALGTQSYIAVDESRGRVYLTDFVNDRLNVLNALVETGCSDSLPAPAATCYPLIASIATGDGPSSVAIDVAANRIYVANTNDRTLTFIDGATFKVLGRLVLPLPPTEMALDTSSPAITYILAVGSVADPGAMLITDTRGGGILSVAPGTLTQPANGATSVSADGTVQYTPAAAFAGVDTFAYRVTDGTAVSANTATVTVAVKAPLTFTTTTLPEATTGSAYAQTISVGGGTPPYHWTFFGIPGGLSASNTTGALTGTPTNAGNFAMSVQVRDSAPVQSFVQREFSLTIGPFSVTSTLPNAALNQSYSATLSAGGSPNKPYTWSLAAGSTLPPGLTLSPAGVVSGMPTQTTCSQGSFTVQVTDSSSPTVRTATRALTLNFSGAQAITTASLLGAAVLENVSTLSATCGSGSQTWSLDSGTLPAGITLNSSGSWSGQPRTHGDFPIVVRATDSTGSVTKNLTLRVLAKEQQGSSQSNPAGASIAFGGVKQIAQTFTVGSHGTLAGIGLTNITCPSNTPLTFQVQRLTLNGRPDGVTIASGSATTNYGVIPVTPSVAVAIDERFAFIVSSPVTCTLNNTSTADQYNGGDAYVNTGSGWSSWLSSLDARYDVPSFRTLIQPALDPAYLPSSHGGLGMSTLLNNGKVLIAGNTANVELYDPTSNTATATGSMSISRQNATVTLLGDGTVLIVGGRDPNNNRLATAEIYNPVAGTFSPANGVMANARESHRATRYVQAGVEKVLITGGVNSAGSTFASAEIYDVSSKTFSAIGNMLNGRQQHGAVLLSNGKILLAGGYNNGSSVTAELFDPAAPVATAFTATANNMVVGNRGILTATVLNDNNVLITGGQAGDVRSEAEIYDVTTGLFAATGNMSSKRYNHTATLLDDGSVLIAGGYDQQNQASYILPLATLERYVPGSGAFVSAGGMQTRRASQTAIRLNAPDNRVLIAGGFSQSWMTGNTAERYDRTNTPTFAPTTVPDASTNGAYPGVTFTASGGTPQYTIEKVSGVLPSDITYDQGTQTLSGPVASTPRATGVYPLGFKVTDAASNSTVETRTIRVGTINTISSQYRLDDGYVDQNYWLQLQATGAPAIAWALAPNSSPLPPGLTLNALVSGTPVPGLIAGSPTTQGYYNFTVRAVDSTGQVAIKVLSISINSPLSITTTTLGDGFLFSGYGGSINASNGNGSRTFIVSAGALPPGVTLSPGGSFGGTVGALGTFNFTVRVTDSSAQPQTATQPLSIHVALATDQNAGSDSNQPPIGFGAPPPQQIAERVITSVSGTLSGIRINGNNICQPGTTVTAQIQGVAPNGGPNGVGVTSGSAVYPFPNDYIALNPPVFFAADQQFTIVFNATAPCSVRPQSNDNYPGEGYVFGATWQRLHDIDPRYDIPFQTLVVPSAGLSHMTASRGYHAAIVLANGLAATNGKILMVSNQTAELYDPTTGTFTATGNLNTSRQRPGVALLSDGTVLVAGGSQCVGSPTCTTVYLSSAELYHPDTGTFELLTNAMQTARANHTATKLGDNSVLLTGGSGSGGSLLSAEIYNPGQKTFLFTGSMQGARNSHTATLLNDGRVLITGGYGSYNSTQGALLYASGIFTPTANTMVAPFRGEHTSTVLPVSGNVLLVGGGAGQAANAEIFNPVGNTFTAAGALLQPRSTHSASLLGDGSVLIAGGLEPSAVCCPPVAPIATLERYVPGTGFQSAGSLLVSRYVHSATTLPNGQVLLAGTWGWSSSGGRFAEFYDPANAVSLVSTSAPQGQNGTAYAGFTVSAQGGSGGHTITLVSGAVPGLTYNPGTRTLSGTPTQSGTFSLGFRVADSAGHTNTQTVLIRVDPLVITTTTLPTAYQNMPYNATLTATGIGAKTWSVAQGSQSLPGGLTLNPNGTITGSTTQSCCNFSFTVEVIDALGQVAQRSLTINVQVPLTITTASLPDGLAGETYNANCLNWSGGNGAITWSLSGQIPIGMALQTTGNGQCFDQSYPARVLRQGGSFLVTVQATDTSGQTTSRNYPIKVLARDQWPNSQFNAPAVVTLPTAWRIAQVYRASSPFPLSGVHTSNALNCTAATQLTFTLWPVMGQPPHPDESAGAPNYLASATVTASGGISSQIVTFPNAVTIPQGSLFAIVTSFAAGQCTPTQWPTTDSYQPGDAWVDDGTGWTRASGVISRFDIPFSTLVVPPATQRFLSSSRSGATAILADGRVLMIGNDQTMEVYDPGTNTVATLASMSVMRHRPTATRLFDGRVLIVGGMFQNGSQQQATTSAQIFNPQDGTLINGPNLPVGRFGHNATRLANDKVLITGGSTYQNGNQTTLDSALLFSADGTSFATLNMTGARVEHTSTLLTDGRVLILGGWTGSPQPPTMAEIYDPNSGVDGAFSSLASTLPFWPSQHTATRLTLPTEMAGWVLVAGGAGMYPSVQSGTYYFNPGTSTFTPAGTMAVPRLEHTATLLADGRVTFTGGMTNWVTGASTSAVETFNPSTGGTSIVGDTITDRNNHSAELVTIASAERLAISGGSDPNRLSARTIEIVNPASTSLNVTTATLPDGQSGSGYATTPVNAAGGTAAGYQFSVAWGHLPPGLSLSAAGQISGAIDSGAGGVYSFAVRVADSASNQASRALTITVNRLVITSTSPLPSVMAGASYSHQLQASGVGSVGWLFECCGNLPTNFTLSASGLLSGTAPAAPGNYFFNVRATDSSGQVAVRGFSLNVVSALTLVAPAQQLGVTLEYFNVSVQQNNGQGPITWTVNSGSLLPGLNLNSSGFSGDISGVPMRTGQFNAVVRATDANSQTATALVSQRIVAVDQRSWGGQFANTISIQTTQTIAQTLIVAANAPIYGVRAPVTCSAGTLTITLRDVELSGKPGATVLATGTFASPMPADGKFLFAVPAFRKSRDRIAVVFTADSSAGCAIAYPGADDTYYGGALYVGNGSGWFSFPGYADLQVQTLVDAPGLWFSKHWHQNPRIAMTPTGNVVITGDGNVVSIFDDYSRTVIDPSPSVQQRVNGTATALHNGKILLTGGYDGLGATTHAELYDPQTNTITPTAGFMSHARQRHTATRLADGKVLIAGGDVDGSTMVQMAEIYDPIAKTFSDAGNMLTVRNLHQATLLLSGKVLITAGGSNGIQSPSYWDAELYTPGVGFAGVGAQSCTSSRCASMAIRRLNHRDVALPDGRVLITSGQNFDGFGQLTGTMEIFDESCHCFTTLTRTLRTARAQHSATLMGDGRVLIAGGDSDLSNGVFISTYEIVDPADGFRARFGGSLGVSRVGHEAIRLCPQGGCAHADQILLVGGGPEVASQSMEVIDPIADILPLGVAGQSYSTSVAPTAIVATGRSIVSGALPPGLSFNSSTGAITGIPDFGNYQFVVKSTGANGEVAYQSLAIEVIHPQAAPAPGDILISEVRSENGSPVDFVELYNNTDFDFVVSSGGTSTGWAVVEPRNPPTPPHYQLFYVPNGTVMKARSHYVASQWYGAIGPPYGMMSEPMLYAGLAPSNRPIGTQGYGYYDGHRVDAGMALALFNTTDPALWNQAHLLDAFGYTTTSNTLFREGAGLNSPGFIAGDHAFVRRQRGFVMQDTDDNAADFELASVNGDEFGGVQTLLGASGAEHSDAPRRGNIPGQAGLRMQVLDSGVPPTAGVNVMRNPVPSGPNQDQGWIEFRRTIINHTGQPITRLRLRVLDISGVPSLSGDADLRVLSAPHSGLTLSDGTPVAVVGATLDEPPAQPLGGGRNSSLTIPLPLTGLAPGASIHVAFRLGVVVTGNYRFVLDVTMPGDRGFIP